MKVALLLLVLVVLASIVSVLCDASPDARKDRDGNKERRRGPRRNRRIFSQMDPLPLFSRLRNAIRSAREEGFLSSFRNRPRVRDGLGRITATAGQIQQMVRDSIASRLRSRPRLFGRGRHRDKGNKGLRGRA